MPQTHQATVSFERELAANFGARLGYYYVRQQDLIETINARLPYSAFNRSSSLLDPGPDGVPATPDDVGPMTVWDYDPAFRGSNFVASQRVNRPSRQRSMEPHDRRRADPPDDQQVGHDGFGLGREESPVAGWRRPVAQRRILPDRPDLGMAGQADRQLSDAVAAGPLGNAPDLQRHPHPADISLPGTASLGTVTIRTEPYGSFSGTPRSLLNLRVAKDVWRSGSRRLRLSVEGLNVLNGASPWSIISASGSTYGYYTAVDSPRIIRFGRCTPFSELRLKPPSDAAAANPLLAAASRAATKTASKAERDENLLHWLRHRL